MCFSRMTVMRGSPPDSIFFPSYPGPPFIVPYQRAKMHKDFWPVREAARRWGCSYRAARLYMLRHPDQCAMVRIQNARTLRVRWIMTAKAGTKKQQGITGNPDFRRPDWQQKRARAYWERKRMQNGISLKG